MKVIVAMLALLVCAVSQSAEVSIYDRATGQVLATYWHRGKAYVVGEPGHEYEVRVRSRSSGRMLAVTTVDGVNVITGETGAMHQSGYVLEPYGLARIEGWRKSMTRTAAFYFTKLQDSYAARTGRPDNVGVIGVALFHERETCCQKDSKLLDDSRSPPSAPAQSAAHEADKSGSVSARAESKLGTGHGRNEYSAASYTSFERAREQPDETIVIYYNSRRNLIAQGIIPIPERYAQKYPEPFPNGFVPDP